MGIEKAEIKKAAVHEVGVRVDDLLESAKREEVSVAAAKSAFLQGAGKVQDLAKVIDAEEKEGKLSPVEYTIAKRTVDRAGGILRNLAVGAEVHLHQARGKMIACQQMLDSIKKMHTLEEAKIKALQQPPDTVIADDGAAGTARRVSGKHPGDSIKKRRRANLRSVPHAPAEPAPPSGSQDEIPPPPPPESA